MPTCPLGGRHSIDINAYSEHDGYYKQWMDYFIVDSDGIQAGKYYTAARKMEVPEEEEEVKLSYTAGTVVGLQTWINAVWKYEKVNLTLTADIDLTGDECFIYDNDGDETHESNWSNGIRISGTVDGGGHTIKGIKIILDEGTPAAAPFDINEGGVVKNLHLQDVDICGQNAGGLATNNNGTISGCSVSGSVAALGFGYAAGGVVNINNGTVTGCYNRATVKGTDYVVSGIAGVNRGTITACYNTGALSATGTSDMGGIVGQNVSSTITACYWACTGAENGVGTDDSEEQSQATRVDGTIVTWAAAATAMNAATLPTGFGWSYVASTANADEPLKLQAVGGAATE